MNPISVIWVAIICTAGLLPTSPLGVPWDDQWDANYANYAPLVLLVVIGGAALGWLKARRPLHRPGAQHRRPRSPQEFATRPGGRSANGA